MRINEIRKNEANLTLTSDELVMIGNVMWHYEQHYHTDPDASKPDERFHEAYAQILTASNLCRYGHLDNFALEQILTHHIQSGPKDQIVDKMLDMLKRTAEQALIQADELIQKLNDAGNALSEN